MVDLLDRSLSSVLSGTDLSANIVGGSSATESGKKDTPVAIIQDGTTSKERIGVGTVDTIETVVQELKLTNPSIIVIGEVVKHREQLLNLQLEIAQNA